MKLKSVEKLEDVQLRVKLNERLAGMLKDYVAYANTVLGHHFEDEKELAVEVFRAFLEGDRGFRQWMAQQQTSTPVVTMKQKKDKTLDGAAFENGLGVR